MGFFDFLRKERKEKKSQVMRKNEMTKHNKGSKFTINNITTEEGNRYIRVDYFDAESEFPAVYNSTRLVMKEKPIVLKSQNKVYDASVSWYNDKKNNYDIYTLYDVYLGLDLEKLVLDEKYQRAVMTKLLQQKRIIEFIKKGDDGKDYVSAYIGEIQLIEHIDKYRGNQETEYLISVNEQDSIEVKQMIKNEENYQNNKRKKTMELKKKIDDREAR